MAKYEPYARRLLAQDGSPNTHDLDELRLIGEQFAEGLRTLGSSAADLAKIVSERLQLVARAEALAVTHDDLSQKVRAFLAECESRERTSENPEEVMYLYVFAATFADMKSYGGALMREHERVLADFDAFVASHPESAKIMAAYGEYKARIDAFTRGAH